VVPAAPCGGRFPHLIILADRDGARLIVLEDWDGALLVILAVRARAHVVLVVEFRLLPFPFPGGGRTSVAGPAGGLVGALLAVGRGPGDLDPTIGVTSHLPDCQAALVESRH
jgi:hypothetical protein